MAFDARIEQRGILVATEGEHHLIHLLGVEHLEAYEQVEVLHRQTKALHVKLGWSSRT